MKEINLREFYPEIYKTDLFISLPDEVVDVLIEYQRKEMAYRRRTYRHKAFLSLDYGDDIEREAVLFTPTLQEIVERHLEEERMYQAISSLPEKQRQRVYAHYILGITLMDIAKMEGVSLHAVYESIQRGLRRLEKILEENFYPPYKCTPENVTTYRRTIFGDNAISVSENLQQCHTHLYMQTSSQPFIWTLKTAYTVPLGTFPVFRAANGAAQ